MADAPRATSEHYQPVAPKSSAGILTINPAPLRQLPGSEPGYCHLFAVRITNTDWKNFEHEIGWGNAPVARQADLRKAHFDALMLPSAKPKKVAGLNLALKMTGPSLVIIHLKERGATFEDRDPKSKGDVNSVIMKDSNELDMIFQPCWLMGSNQKTISVIVDPSRTAGPISYALRIRTEAGSIVTYHDIDPKIENEGGMTISAMSV